MTRILPCLADLEKIRVIAEAGDARIARNFQTSRLKMMKGVGLDEQHG